MNDQVLVLRKEAQEKTLTGIIIPDTAKETPLEGTVIAVGAGRLNKKGERVSMNVKKGDHILFSRFAGVAFQLDGVEHLMMKEKDILAVLE
jgi:chaperonin GroES